MTRKMFYKLQNYLLMKYACVFCQLKNVQCMLVALLYRSFWMWDFFFRKKEADSLE